MYGAGPRVPAQVQWLASRSSAENPHELRKQLFQEAPKSPELTVQYRIQVKALLNIEDPVLKYTVYGIVVESTGFSYSVPNTVHYVVISRDSTVASPYFRPQTCRLVDWPFFSFAVGIFSLLAVQDECSIGTHLRETFSERGKERKKGLGARNPMCGAFLLAFFFPGSLHEEIQHLAVRHMQCNADWIPSNLQVNATHLMNPSL